MYGGCVMNIKLFISKAGRIILTCDSFFKQRLESVIFDNRTRRIALKFAEDKIPYMLNCEVDDVMADAMNEKNTCGFGFEKDGKIEHAIFLPLLVAHREIRKGARA